MREEAETRDTILREIRETSAGDSWKDSCARMEKGAIAMKALLDAFAAVGFTDEQAQNLVKVIVWGHEQ